jgi:hypothetical protein
VVKHNPQIRSTVNIMEELHVSLMAEEPKAHGVAAVPLTLGWLRSEAMLDGFWVTEENWQHALERNPDFASLRRPSMLGGL